MYNLAVISLTAVTEGIDDVQTAVLAGVAGVVTAGVALMAIRYGGRWLITLFKGFSK